MNNIAFFEIQASRPEAAAPFYTGVFGWQFLKETGLPVDYWRIVTEGIHGGLMARPAAAPPTGTGTNAFVCSVQVENFDETAEKIARHGGTVALEKFAVPGRCWQGYFIDTEQNTFGIFQPIESVG